VEVGQNFYRSSGIELVELGLVAVVVLIFLVGFLLETVGDGALVLYDIGGQLGGIGTAAMMRLYALGSPDLWEFSLPSSKRCSFFCLSISASATVRCASLRQS
jgi:hypothetical protein